MMNLISKVLLSVAETLLLIGYFNLLLKKVEKLRIQSYIWYVLFFIFQSVTYFIDFPFFSTSYFYVLFSFIIGHFFFYEHTSIKLALASIFVMLNYASKLLSATAYLSLFHAEMVSPFSYVLNPTAQGISCFIMLLSLSLIALIKRFKNKHFQILLTLNISIILPLLILYLTMNILKVKNALELCYNISASLFLYTFLLLYLCLRLMTTNAGQLEASIIRDKLKLQSQYYKDLEQYNISLSRYRHDMANHFTILWGILERNDVDAAKNYLQTIQSTLHSLAHLYNTGNSVINIIINSKAAIAREHNIKFNFDIVIPPTLNIDDTSLSIIMFNILDNAIEASMKLEEGVERIINTKMHIYKNMLFISVTNNYSGTIISDNFSLISTKETKYLHGYGLKNVAFIVEKHKGNISLNHDNNKFVISIVLPLG